MSNDAIFNPILPERFLRFNPSAWKKGAFEKLGFELQAISIFEMTKKRMTEDKTITIPQSMLPDDPRERKIHVSTGICERTYVPMKLLIKKEAHVIRLLKWMCLNLDKYETPDMIWVDEISLTDIELKTPTVWHRREVDGVQKLLLTHVGKVRTAEVAPSLRRVISRRILKEDHELYCSLIEKTKLICTKNGNTNPDDLK